MASQSWCGFEIAAQSQPSSSTDGSSHGLSGLPMAWLTDAHLAVKHGPLQQLRPAGIL